MFWIFAAVVLVLLVLHKPFRKFSLYGAAATALLIALWFAAYQWHQRGLRAAEDARIAAFDAKYSACAGKEPALAYLNCVVAIDNREPR